MAKVSERSRTYEEIPVSVREDARKKLQKYMEEESKMVKGRFRSYENPGATERISYKKYPTRAEMAKRGESGGVTPFEKDMTDNEVYEVPLYVAKFLNGHDITAEAIGGRVNSCSYPQHFYEMGRNEMPSKERNEGIEKSPYPYSTKYKRRFGFESLEFGG